MQPVSVNNARVQTNRQTDRQTDGDSHLIYNPVYGRKSVWSVFRAEGLDVQRTSLMMTHCHSVCPHFIMTHTHVQKVRQEEGESWAREPDSESVSEMTDVA